MGREGGVLDAAAQAAYEKQGDAALALSLTKRMREILFGVPALIAWQWLEARTVVIKDG